MKSQTTIASLLLLGSISAFAGPVTTTPWNGHTGAATFTYDDARDGQIPNLIPQLDSLHIKATFEIAARSVGTFIPRLNAWLQVAKNGHELANHTYSHVSINTLSDAAIADTVRVMAAYLRGLDTSIQSVTFAYPNCNVPGTTTGKNGVNAKTSLPADVVGHLCLGYATLGLDEHPGVDCDQQCHHLRDQRAEQRED